MDLDSTTLNESGGIPSAMEDVGIKREPKALF
jgi:hypothetical protein